MATLPNRRPLVIYHANCWDGFCAAWVAHRALGTIEAVPAHYGTPPPDCTGRTVYILDFSYPRDVLLTMATQASRVVLLDHHRTAEADLQGIDRALVCVVFDMEKSGGRLALDYFFPEATRVPALVAYTEDRDLWRHALPHSREINAALRSYPLDFDVWSGLEVQGLTTLVKEGEAIRRRETQIVADHIRRARTVEMAGHQVQVVNATVLHSEIAGALAKGRPFGACYFDRQDGTRQWSLRSDEHGVDVSEIATARGGGGHVHAAGFQEERPDGRALVPPEATR